MNHRAVVRYAMLGGLVTGLALLTGGGVDAAAAGESPAALCRSTFGDGGPVGGPVVGEGPSGDPMSTTIGWDPSDWSDGLREVVTCVSVGGRAAPALTTTLAAPPNDGSLTVSLKLPPGQPGALVCEQSVLIGAGDAAGRHRTTSPVCFKLRAAGPPVPKATAPVNAPAPSPYPSSTPPARAAFEARSETGIPNDRPAVPTPTAAAPAPAWPPDPAPAARAGRSAAAAAAPSAPAPAAGAPVTALARTGLDEHIPLAGAGGFLALGGAAIILGAPRRRRPARRSVDPGPAPGREAAVRKPLSG